METFLWPGCASDPQGEIRVALLVPGAGYKAESPLLYWPAEQLKDRGWQVRGIRWTDGDEPGNDPHGFAARAVERAFAESPAGVERLIVAKSFGSFAIPWAEESEVPAIWLTPVLTDAVLRTTLIHSKKPDLLIGGSKDKLWVADGLSESAAEVLEIQDADHALQVPNDWRASLAAHAQAFTAVEGFLANF